MSGKDLLAALAMIVPSLILIAAIALGLGLSGRKEADERQDASMRAKPQVATQKRMRAPWERPPYTKTSSAPRAPQCDPEKVERDGRCLYR